MIVYKLFNKRKDGSIGPLFINRKLRLDFNTWYPAESHPTKGYAFRPGWHCTVKPEAPHLSNKDRPWNTKFNVGHKRIYSLTDLIKN